MRVQPIQDTPNMMSVSHRHGTKVCLTSALGALPNIVASTRVESISHGCVGLKIMTIIPTLVAKPLVFSASVR